MPLAAAPLYSNGRETELKPPTVWVRIPPGAPDGSSRNRSLTIEVAVSLPTRRLGVVDRFRWLREGGGSYSWRYTIGHLGAAYVAALRGVDPPRRDRITVEPLQRRHGEQEQAADTPTLTRGGAQSPSYPHATGDAAALAA